MEFPISFLEEFESYFLYHCDVIDSTNSYFKREHPYFSTNSVLIADTQQSGRGRYIRKWNDTDGDLLFSILKKDDFRYEIYSCVSVLRVLRSLDIKAFIKWPNDLFVEDKKMCGILIEDLFKGKDRLCQIIGIGLNLKDKEEIHAIGVNHFLECDKYFLAKEILKRLNELVLTPFDEVLNEYTSNNLVYHRKIRFKNEEFLVSSFTKEGYLKARNLKTDEEILINCDEINIKESILS